MKQFFKFTFASMLGTFLSLLLLGGIGALLIFGMIAGMMGSISKLSSDKESDIEEKEILKIELDQPIKDRGGKKRFKFDDLSAFKETGLNDIIDALEKARNDDRIKGVRLELDKVVAGMATLNEFRNALERFRDSSNKFLVVYDKFYSQRSYYLASAADRLEMYPEGGMSFKGLSSEVMFFKGAMDKLNVDMQVVRGSNNKYKSAVEPFTRKKMSDPSRKQMEAYLSDLWELYLKDVSKDRNIPREKLQRIADSLLVRSPSDAVDLGFVDALSYPDEFKQGLRDSLGLEEDKEVPYVAFSDYMEAEVPDEHWTGGKREKEKKGPDKEEAKKIAVVYASGGIQSGENGENVLGSKTTSEAIRKAREDSSIKAIVMRVNSPGGSALASDRIWREVELTRKEKPFIVSMGDLAASGGYYISCSADRIFASPNTITGSIGVFGMFPHVGDMYKEKLGITFDRVKTNEYADMISSTHPLRTKERKVIRQQIDSTYRQFLQRVAEGRDMAPSEVDSIARGRVWSGKDAKRVGLVDELGGLKEAIAYASDKAGLEDPERKAFPEREDPFQRFMDNFNTKLKKKVLHATLGQDMHFYRKYRYLRSVSEMKGIQMRMPYHIEVK
ncbi:MAG: signal peptide peptidase SppA [Flavobacteriales bacterium]